MSYDAANTYRRFASIEDADRWQRSSRAAPGVKYRPDKKVVCADKSTPFKTVPITKAMRLNNDFTDLTGIRFGRLTVYGLSDAGDGRWACRCDCGRYTLRKKKAVLNPTNNIDRCEHCRHLAYLKREDHYRSTGRDREWGA